MMRALLLCLALPLALKGAVGMQEKLGATIPASLVLQDEAGRPVVLGSLLDKPTLLTLNYFRCAGICSPQLNAIADALGRIEAVPGKDFQVLTVSFDARDTPAIAARKRENYLHQVSRPLPPEAWRFLTGSAPTTRALAEAVGFGFEARGEDFDHPAVIVVLSPKGKVTRYLYGLSYVPAELQMAAQEAARGETRGSLAKVLNICFRYDPERNRHVFSLTRCCGGIVLVAALAFLAGLIARRRQRRLP